MEAPDELHVCSEHVSRDNTFSRNDDDDGKKAGFRLDQTTIESNSRSQAISSE